MVVGIICSYKRSSIARAGSQRKQMAIPNRETEANLTKRLSKNVWAESRENKKVVGWNTLGLATVGSVTTPGCLQKQGKAANNRTLRSWPWERGHPRASVAFGRRRQPIPPPQHGTDTVIGLKLGEWTSSLIVLMLSLPLHPIGQS